MLTISENLKQKISLIPNKPGVYLMKNSIGKIIYVGKAKILKNRVRTYFTGKYQDLKTEQLVENISDFDYIITATEVDALVLENNLIKKHKPKYNIYLRDDKQYPFIKITMKEPFPRIEITRKLLKDGSKYFGPYTDSRAIKKTLRLLEWIFPFRTCTRKIPTEKVVFDRPCINYQLGKCSGACIGKISKQEYKKIISNIFHFLNGRNTEVISNLKQEMQLESEIMNFEKAAQTRDKINNIYRLNRSHNMFFTDDKNRDVVGIYKEENKAAVAVLKILSGKLLNKEIYSIENAEGRKISEILEAFLKQYYAEKIDKLPHKIILQIKPDDYETLNFWLKNKLLIPQRGEMKALISISKENAFNYVEEQKLKYLRKSSRTIYPITELKEKLGLKKLPRKMACFDISTIQGTDTVASLVFFENGKPKKKNYRHYIIKTVQGQDDFASLSETLQRYLIKIDEQEKPDLIIIDGGKGQLSSAFGVLKQMKLEKIEMISLAKRMEEVFLPDNSKSIILPRSSSALRLLINIRDEAHRFAINFHRKRRTNRTLTSELDRINGIGTETKFLLLKELGSIKNIKNSSIDKLTEIKGIGEKTAKKILDGLNFLLNIFY
ncbi:MAG: excinuclease ABC subunit UvrC [Armatimonadetes bacterium]|nr:excinuclease ABC subunit UvrC [Armatimonadota bacterium]